MTPKPNRSDLEIREVKATCLKLAMAGTIIDTTGRAHPGAVRKDGKPLAAPEAGVGPYAYLQESEIKEPLRVNFPENLSLEELAKIYRDIEDGGKDVIPPINVPYDCNVIPSSRKGDCRENLVGFIFNKKDFENRMPAILASFIRCQYRQVLLATCYWDGIVWEKTWKKPFEAVGGEVYRQMYDVKGRAEQIL